MSGLTATIHLRRPPRGFTLIEILCVVVILGISAAIILPMAGNRSDLQAASMARMLMADLTYAQGRAVAAQRRQYVRFDVTNNRYEVLDQISPSDVFVTHPLNQTAFSVPLGTNRDDELKTVGLESVSFDTQTVLMYDELGAPHAYNASTNTSASLVSGSIVLRSGTYLLTVTVEPFSGELKVN